MKTRPNIGYVFLTQRDNNFKVKDFSSKYANPIIKAGDVVYVNRTAVVTKIYEIPDEVIFVFSEDDVVYITSDKDKEELLVE